MATKEQTVLQVAQELYKQGPDWVTFFREVMGLGGIVRQAYKTQESFTQFEKTKEFQEIQRMLGELRKRRGGGPEEAEPTTVITVRLPRSLHESLKIEARDRNMSMNKLCIAKLLQLLDKKLIVEATEAEQAAVDAAHFGQ